MKSEIKYNMICRYIRKGMFMEIGKGDTSATFNQILELLMAKNEYLAFAPDTPETRKMINILSFKFPLLQVIPIYGLCFSHLTVFSHVLLPVR